MDSLLGDTPNANTKFKALTSAQYFATGKTPMAFAQKGYWTSSFLCKIFRQKDFMVNASFISGRVNYYGTPCALSVEASKMNINGTLRWGIVAGLRCCFWIIALSIG